MKFTANQLALMGVNYFKREGRIYDKAQLLEIVEAVYEFVRLGDPYDTALVTEYIKFVFNGEKEGIFAPEAKDDLTLIIGKAAYWA